MCGNVGSSPQLTPIKRAFQYEIPSSEFTIFVIYEMKHDMDLNNQMNARFHVIELIAWSHQ